MSAPLFASVLVLSAGDDVASSYSKASGGTACGVGDRIYEKDECQSAGAATGHPFQKVVSDTGRPLGCFWDQGGGSYLNTNMAGFTRGWSGVGGLCKRDGENFDVRTAYPGCATEVLNQGGCGSCWAFGTIGAVSDRFCVVGKKITLSPQSLVSCMGHWGCGGGAESGAYAWIAEHGLQTCTNQCKSGCEPYGSVYTSGKPASCTNDVLHDWCHGCDAQCLDGSRATFYKVESNSYVHAKLDSEEKRVMAEISTHGSVTGGLSVYANWGSWVNKHGKDAVYDSHEGSAHHGAHSIKIVGYGVSQGKKYWLVQNSWGTGFADGGYIKVLRGDTKETDGGKRIIWDDAHWATPAKNSGGAAANSTSQQASGVATTLETPFPLTGGWSVQDHDEPYYLEMAYETFFQANAPGVPMGVKRVETQVVAGLNVRFEMDTTFGGVAIESHHDPDGKLLSVKSVTSLAVV